MFELELLRGVLTENNNDSSNDENKDDEPDRAALTNTDRRGSQGMKSILLTGQMRYVKDINCIMFLCSPL